jgi:hypothetical protein
VDPFIAVYDACVLYPAPLRSLLVYLALAGLFRARWTDAIHEEWMRSVLRDYPDVTRAKAERVRELMNAAVPDCLVTGYENLIPSLSLPDPEDRHVLAAAIRAGASVLVTANLKDFPADVLSAHGIEAMHPDDFVVSLLDLDADAVCAAVRAQRESLRNPPKTAEELLVTLETQGLTQAVARLRAFAAVL